MQWTLTHMSGQKRLFYYQLKKESVFPKICFIWRWSNALYVYAMSYYLLESNRQMEYKKLKRSEDLTPTNPIELWINAMAIKTF